MAQRGLLIVTADDVGRDAYATDNTLECLRAGRITSASAMVYMKDSDRASILAREARLPAGLHINVSEAFTDPATPPQVRARQARLVRRFGSDRGRQLRRWSYDPLIRADVEACIVDQIERFSELYGAFPSNVDGHQHVHLCPNVFLARSLPSGMRMRRTLDTYPLKRSPHAVARALRERMIARRFAGTDYFFDIAEVDPRRGCGPAAAGLRLADRASVEVMTHPGFNCERECLMSPEWEQALRGRVLGSFADLESAPHP